VGATRARKVEARFRARKTERGLSMLKKILAGLAVVVAGFLVFVATRPAQYHVERKVAISAPTEVIYAELEDLRRWSAWSPWEKLDPNMKKTFQGPEHGVGASYSWQGNSDAGKGRMTIESAEAPTHVRYKLEFMEPMEGIAHADMKIEKAGEKANTLTWGMDGENNFIGKAFSVFVDMDKMIGKDFEAGLTKLKGIAEAEAEKQRLAAQAAPAGEPQAEAPKATEQKLEGNGP
jgi:hypothetical protein